MLIPNRRAFALGLLLSASFLAVLALLFSPLAGDGRNGLQYADDMFNRLSKGSSWFIPRLEQHVQDAQGAAFAVTLQPSGSADAALLAGLLASAGAATEPRGSRLHASGDLGQVLAAALRDAADGYRNDHAALQARHGAPARAVLHGWWQVLRQTDMALKLEGRPAQAKAAHEVMKKGIEPAHNYLGIEAEQVGNMLGPLVGLLLFYVLYTVWWGYAIFYLFEGLGLVMKKASHGPDAPPAPSPASAAPGREQATTAVN